MAFSDSSYVMCMAVFSEPYGEGFTVTEDQGLIPSPAKSHVWPAHMERHNWLTSPRVGGGD